MDERTDVYLKYEYEYPVLEKLEGDAAIRFNVPISLIIDTEMHSMRLSLFAYLSVYRGFNNRMCFSVPLFLEWAGYKSDARKGAINDKVLETLDMLHDLGYVYYCSDKPRTRTACFEIEFNRQLVFDLGYEESFGILYWDEVQKIMQYRNKNTQDKYLNCNTVLLVFAFLRQAIYRMPNKLKPEERTAEGVAARRKCYIEAYNGNYREIAFVLGLTERCVSGAVRVLEELKLIVTANAWHIKNEDGDFRTPDIIFANAEKRDGDDLLTKGDAYALGEIKRKEEYLRSYIPSYRLRRNKFGELFNN